MKAGWDIVSIDEITQLVTKGTTPTSVGHSFTEEGVNFIKVESLTADGQFLPNKLAHVSMDCHNSLRRSQIEAGDILFSIAGALGRTAVVPEEIVPANTNQALSIIRLKPDAGVHTPFLAYALSSGMLLDQVEKARGGVAQQNLSLAQVKSFSIPLPPLEEQKQIVAVLDKAFEGLSRARANADANLQNARDLFESYRQDVLALNGNKYVEAPLSSLAKFSQGKQVGLKEQSLEKLPGMTRFIRIVDYTQEGTEHRFVTDPGKRYKVEADDIVMVRYGSPGLIGRGQAGVIANNMFRVSADNTLVSNDYLAFALEARSVRDFLGSRGSSTMPALNFGHLDEVIVRYPSLEVQASIVGRAISVKAEVLKLRSTYESKKSRLNDLRQSVLTKAFAGELT